MSFKFAKFYTRGWGDASVYRNLYRLLDSVHNTNSLISEIHPFLDNVNIKIKEEKEAKCFKSYLGEFTSPATHFLPNTLPEESIKSSFQLILPTVQAWPYGGKQPMCVHLAGTGDHFFWRRRNFVAGPLAKEYGIGSIILENPFYGTRRPKGQLRSSLQHVSDTFVMGAALLLEVVALLKWCQKRDYGPLGVSGVSLGGYMTGVASSGWPDPMVIVPCLSWTTAAPVFTEGAMCHNIAWHTLQNQLETDHSYTKLLQEFSSSLLQYRNKEYKDYPSQISKNESHFDEGLRLDYSQTRSSDDKTGSHKKRQSGSMSLDFNISQILSNIQQSLSSTIQERVNFDNLRELTAFTDKDSISKASQETIDFMNMLMNKSTHMKEFNSPHPKSKVTFVVANHDRYVPWMDVSSCPQDYWNDIEYRYIEAGHVMAILQNHHIFRLAIYDAFKDFQLNTT